jgi:hypothetical protein
MAQIDYSNTRGLDFITKQSFTTASSVDFDNCFSTKYVQYRIICNALSSATDVGVSLKFRTGGTTNSGAIYNWQYLVASTTVLAAGRAASSTGGWANALGQISTDLNDINITEINNPFQSTYSFGFVRHAQQSNAAINNDLFSFGTNVTTSFDGFSAFPGSGTFTGTIYVYGLVNS